MSIIRQGILFLMLLHCAWSVAVHTAADGKMTIMRRENRESNNTILEDSPNPVAVTSPTNVDREEFFDAAGDTVKFKVHDKWPAAWPHWYAISEADQRNDDHLMSNRRRRSAGQALGACECQTQWTYDGTGECVNIQGCPTSPCDAANGIKVPWCKAKNWPCDGMRGEDTAQVYFFCAKVEEKESSDLNEIQVWVQKLGWPITDMAIVVFDKDDMEMTDFDFNDSPEGELTVQVALLPKAKCYTRTAGQGLTCNGIELSSYDRGATNVEQCQARCNGYSECKAIAFYKRLQRCYLYSECNGAQPSSESDAIVETPHLCEELAHVGVADNMPDGDYLIKTSEHNAKLLRVVHHSGKAWAMVSRKIGKDKRFFSTEAVNDAKQPNIASAFKLSDEELHFLTNAHIANWGLILVPNYDAGHLRGNLIRRDQHSRAYPIGGSTAANQGDMAKSALDSDVYPSTWDEELNDNSHCGGVQVWANWVSSNAYKFRYTSSNGCSYFNEGFNGVQSSGDYGGSIYGFVGGGAQA